MKNSFKML